MAQKYSGGCQCGNVRYEVTLDLGTVMSCNCSRCSKWGALLAFAPVSDFKLLSGDGDMTDYQFHKHRIHHLFCSICGIQPFGRGIAPSGNEMAAINVRCLDGVDVDALTVKKFDGKALL